MTQPKTAILIFANSAKREGSLKSFRKSVVLFRELNKNILEKVISTGLPYFISSEKEQIGNSFAQRYTHSVQGVFDQGFDNVITIGNDTPHLQSSQLLKTADLLATNKMVLGPSCDGGYYLLGINKSHFNQNEFLNFSWQTDTLAAEVSQFLKERQLDIVLLKTLSDIDSASDIFAVLQDSKLFSEKLISLLKHIILPKKKFQIKKELLISSLFKNIFLNKGSPILMRQ
ncbi:TIGR04282 family arsenosugar biosynthesis glycosyltransferase [Cochleicola gelatinilyticus]|uniref:Glycosyltransferase n=1 Tax=Cochleicola gelatinilyticus TaxID=1763537 RepID=A0A167IMD1_9FLAO|nr:DUF2064 domain-containing protein [Cochleicola gelatinilyticus]OAB79824.1 hypothetical protein ULVI_03535 [Cochleicola gelatinilyticus]